MSDVGGGRVEDCLMILNIRTRLLLIFIVNNKKIQFIIIINSLFFYIISRSNNYKSSSMFNMGKTDPNYFLSFFFRFLSFFLSGRRFRASALAIYLPVQSF